MQDNQQVLMFYQAQYPPEGNPDRQTNPTQWMEKVSSSKQLRQKAESFTKSQSGTGGKEQV